MDQNISKVKDGIIMLALQELRGVAAIATQES